MEKEKGRRIARAYFDDDDVEEEENSCFEYELNDKAECVEHLKFLRGLLMPLIETYTVTAYSLDKLVGRELLESELVAEIVEEMKARLADDSIKYGRCWFR